MTTNVQTTDPLVLVISASVGAGHNQAAKAILEGLKRAAPNLRTQWLDSMQFVPRTFRAWYAGGFSTVCTKFPKLYGLGFTLTNRPQTPARGLNEKIRLASEYRSLRRLREEILRLQPALIVHTHFLAPPMVHRMVEQGQIVTRQLVVVTDVPMHRWWYCGGVEHWFVAQPCTAEPFARWGIDPARVTVSGIPIHPKWTEPVDRAAVLQQWNLPADRPIVLLTGGAEYTAGPVVRIAKGLLRECPAAQVAVMGGRNKTLLAELGTLAAGEPRLTPIAFTDRAQELVAVCSLMITKAGGMTTAECLAKGTPMVLLRPVPGQEGGNAAFLASQGAALVTAKATDVIAAAKRLLDNPAELASLARSAKQLYRPGTQTIVEAILRSLHGNSPSRRP